MPHATLGGLAKKKKKKASLVRLQVRGRYIVGLF